MTAFSHHFVESNGIRMHYVEAGAGPLVVLCHGFPESWSSWRHQLAALAEAGFHAVAPDQRGYGQTDSRWRLGNAIMSAPLTFVCFSSSRAGASSWRRSR